MWFHHLDFISPRLIGSFLPIWAVPMQPNTAPSLLCSSIGEEGCGSRDDGVTWFRGNWSWFLSVITSLRLSFVICSAGCSICLLYTHKQSVYSVSDNNYCHLSGEKLLWWDIGITRKTRWAVAVIFFVLLFLFSPIWAVMDIAITAQKISIQNTALSTH